MERLILEKAGRNLWGLSGVRAQESSAGSHKLALRTQHGGFKAEVLKTMVEKDCVKLYNASGSSHRHRGNAIKARRTTL
ncbi:hypothetical protein L916_03601 [Phytophthora nicotianae]|uniref:Uncharacterized protein n=1 Tax=Phytophthora nicotianae TaxID=4792 RepID=W2JJE8_PHYNI|nr:hypothetical protein L916_03601 [Phytophthora nicotianae]